MVLVPAGISHALSHYLHNSRFFIARIKRYTFCTDASGEHADRCCGHPGILKKLREISVRFFIGIIYTVGITAVGNAVSYRHHRRHDGYCHRNRPDVNEWYKGRK